MKINLLIAGTGYIELSNIAENGFTPEGHEIEVIGFLDDNEANKSRNLLGKKIIGGFSDLSKYPDAYVINSIARNMELRSKTTSILNRYGAKFTSIIHESCSYSDLKIGIGSFIGPFGVIETNVEIGNHTCVLSSCVISHDSKIGDFCFIGHHSTLSGFVSVKEKAFVAAGSVLHPQVEIGKSAIVGMNSTILRDVKDESTICAPLSKRIK